MKEYLLSANVLILCSIAAAAGCALFYNRIVRRMSLRHIAIGVVGGLAALGIEVYILASTFGLQDTPAGAYYIALACNVIAGVTAMGLRRPASLLYGSVAFIGCFLLLSITVNDYYQYFPTFQSIFFTNKREVTSTLTTAHVHGKYPDSTLEQVLYGNGLSHGTVNSQEIPGVVSGLKARPAYVYLPPAYNDAASAAVKFPVLVLLTGTPGTPSSWLQGGQLTSAMDQFASHHAGITPIVVIADHSGSFNNDTECVDSPHGNADTYLTVDVPSFVKKQYRVSTNPLNWGIGGFSEGGMCAAMLTLKHQDVYRHFLDLAGDPFPYLNNTKQTLPILFAGSKQAQKESNINWLLANKPLSDGLTAQFAIGANDNRRLISELQGTYRLAAQHKIPSSFETVAHQGHNFTAWIHGYTDSLPKLSYYLGATQCETMCAQ